MKKCIIYLLILALFAECKKSSDTSEPPSDPPLENYIKIDSDKRLLGEIPSDEVTFKEEPNGDFVILDLSTNKKAIDIDGSGNEYLIMSITLFDTNTPSTEYKIENIANPSRPSAKVTVILFGNNLTASMTAKAGWLYVTRDQNNKIKSFRFENSFMDGTYEAMVSCAVTLKQ